MRAWVFASLTAGLALAPAVAASQSGLPGELRKHLASLDSECRGYGGRPGKSPQLVKSADLTGDGVPDHVVDLNAYNCDGAASAMGAGQSGAAVAVFVGGPGATAKRAFDGLAYGTKIVSAGGRSRLYLDTAGVDCGQRAAPGLPFSDWKFCSRPLNWNAARQAFVFAPVAEARPIQ